MPPRRAVVSVLVASSAAALAVAATLSGPPPASGVPAEGCDAPAHREFDFWVGEWRVRNSDGEVIGRNTIRRVAGGCGILEQWRSARGQTGTSLNFYDPAAGRWTQHWVGSEGMMLHLEGGLRDGRMVLEGTREAEGGPLHDRIAWEPGPGGRVLQTWSTSTDGGESWEQAWQGEYLPADD